MSLDFAFRAFSKKKKALLISSLAICSFVLFSPSDSLARVINASSGSTNAIQSAINQASAGDTVMIPAGTFTYSGTITISSEITLLGAGKTATVLKKSGTSTTAMFVVNNSERTTIGNFSLVGIESSSSRIQDNGIRINNSKDFHIFEVAFSHFGYSAVYARGNCRGVIRKCDFIDIYRSTIGNLGYGVVVYGDRDGAWSRPLDLGTEKAVYVEDCYFRNNRHAIASNDGSRYVFRYNTVMDNASNFHPIDAHGREYGSPRGSRSYEIYGNTVDNTVRNSWCHILIRGGDGVIFDNTFLGGTGSTPILLVNRTDGGHTSTSYPAPDQTRSLYVWDNKVRNGNTVGVTVRPGHTSFFQLGRDFFHEKMPDYTPYTYPHPLSGPVPPAVITKSLPIGVEGFTYEYALEGEGGEGPYSWSIIEGSLPNGLNLSSTGTISGTPEAQEVSTFTVQLTDTSGDRTTKEFSLEIRAEDEVNLANEFTYIDDCGYISSGNPVSGLWDGDLSGETAASPGTSAADSLWVEYDLKRIHNLSKIRLYGDDVDNWVSRQYSVYVKNHESDDYHPIIENENCFASTWFEKELTETARFIKLVVKGNSSAGSVQLRQFEVYGTTMPVTSAFNRNVSTGKKAGILSQSNGIIRYSMPEAADVRLSIHDMKGRTLAVPFRQKMVAGVHELRVDSQGNLNNRFAAGSYIYKLSIGKESFIVSKPLLKK